MHAVTWPHAMKCSAGGIHTRTGMREGSSLCLVWGDDRISVARGCMEERCTVLHRSLGHHGSLGHLTFSRPPSTLPHSIKISVCLHSYFDQCIKILDVYRVFSMKGMHVYTYLLVGRIYISRLNKILSMLRSQIWQILYSSRYSYMKAPMTWTVQILSSRDSVHPRGAQNVQVRRAPTERYIC